MNRNLPTSLLYLPKQSYIRYFVHKLSKPLIFLTTGASYVKYTYLGKDENNSILSQDRNEWYKRPANVNVNGLIKHRRKHLGTVNSF